VKITMAAVGLYLIFLSLITWVADAALLLASFDPPANVSTFVRQATAGFLWFVPWALILSLPAIGATAWALRTPQGVELAQRIATSAAILGIWWAILALAGLATIFANQGYGPEVIVGALLAGAGVGAGFGLLLPPPGEGDGWRRPAILGMAIGLGLVVALGLAIPQK